MHCFQFSSVLRWWISFFFLWVLCCNKDKKPIEDEPLESKIRLEQVRLSDSSRNLKVFGSVSFFKKAEITSKVLGRIETYFKEEGEFVSAGDVLAKMETLSLEIQLSKDLASLEVQSRQRDLAQAKLTMARQRVDRELANIEKAEADVTDAREIRNNLRRSAENKKKLFEAGAVSETELKSIETSLNSSNISLFKAEKNLESLKLGYRKEDLKKANIPIPKTESELREAFIRLNTMIEGAELDMSEANLKATKKNIEATELLLKEARIKSPIKGIIATRMKGQGEAVKEGEALYVVVDTSKVILKFNVTESDLWKLKKDQTVKFTLDAYPDRNFVGFVHIISPLVDPQTRTVEVKVLSENANFSLKPGMFTRGEILQEDDKKRTFQIPASALSKQVEKRGVAWVADAEGRLFPKSVDVIRVTGNDLEVTGPLQEGAWIAVTELEKISEGQVAKLPKEKSPDSKKGTVPETQVRENSNN
ncbi:HlyD family secretion protein [Leptospira inadai serovar Lyme str. 10]|uniref:HlyD family secretion protein n=2 Tax=Leptospira inadai serovar Lyme TaxID=293084 RepID=V6HZ01_9LEPT|nr:HlyD family secretion protein [Leptospira inadai serovar Lyme str. 10]